ncbi:hypothetical protein GMPD_15460 [Geomonas paludis]|uniref:Uncharacterized protein n=1 Tax=Geomonas paludis TaxID=2740185 RepID=A0A6V8MV74_9BACT|nr:hypothetical protein GMPD_15460 [Geomonas paludis]
MERDPMYEAISRMKFGMTVTEARKKKICIKCRETVDSLLEEYEIHALCSDCSKKAGSYV